MGDISNKTLVALLVVAIAISLIGTWVSVSRISSIPVRVTGFQASQQGITWLEVPQITEITLCVDLVNFSSGYINTSNPNCDFCTINTTCNQSVTSCNLAGTKDNFTNCYGAGTKDTTCCINFTIPSSGFVIENTGTTRINVSMVSAAGPDWLDTNNYDNSEYKFRVYEENNACGAKGEDDYSSWTSMPSSDTVICNDLYPEGSRPYNNSIQVPILVKIPRDLVGVKNDTVTFTATYIGVP